MKIYTDGAASDNGKVCARGGWAYIVLLPDHTTASGSGHQSPATNNQMELEAVIQALFRSYGEIEIISDSQYVVKGATKWRYSWKSRGWRTATGHPVKNIEQWKALDELLSNPARQVKFQWVKGHAGDPMNEMVDRMAVRAAEGDTYVSEDPFS